MVKQELTGLELDIYNKDGDQYDRVTCGKADFDMATGDAVFGRRRRDHAGHESRRSRPRAS